MDQKDGDGRRIIGVIDDRRSSELPESFVPAFERNFLIYSR